MILKRALLESTPFHPTSGSGKLAGDLNMSIWGEAYS